MDVISTPKALPKSNIQNGFKACGIWPLNYDAMSGKMKPATIFTAKVPMEVQIEELIEERGLPTRAEVGTTYYYVDVEVSSSQEQPCVVNVDGEEPQENTSAPANSRNFNDFLRLLQEPLRRMNAREEPIVDYSQSHILTSDQHVQSMQRIRRTKERMAKERAEKTVAREVAMREREEDKEVEKLAKEKRAREW